MITKNYTYKKQGDGRDSWLCEEKDEKGNIINKYMVYENPFLKIDLSNIDIDSLTDEQLLKLKERFFKL